MTEDAAGGTKVEARLDFVGHGCADLFFRLGSETITVPGVCDGADVLGDLVRFALNLATGGSYAECTFDLEPTVLRLAAKRQASDPEAVELTVDWLDRFAGEPAQERLRIASGQCSAEELRAALERAERTHVYQRVSSGRCSAEDLASAIERAATTIRETGPDRYQEIWGWEYPSRAVGALRAALMLPRPQILPVPANADEGGTIIYHILGDEPVQDSNDATASHDSS